jgi:hypothetical protein
LSRAVKSLFNQPVNTIKPVAILGLQTTFTKACRCGEPLSLEYLKKFHHVHKKLKCSNCTTLISLRCAKCIKKQTCVKQAFGVFSNTKNGGKTHLFCDKCQFCYICTPCFECDNNLGMVNTMKKICCSCRKPIPNRCNNCMIKNICKCSQEHCSNCKGCGLTMNLFG